MLTDVQLQLVLKCVCILVDMNLSSCFFFSLVGIHWVWQRIVVCRGGAWGQFRERQQRRTKCASCKIMNAIIAVASYERHVVQIMDHSTGCLTAYSDPHQRNTALLSLVRGIQLLAPCEGNSPVIGELSTQKTSNAEKASIWWRHHESCLHSMSKFEANLTNLVHNESHESTKAMWYTMNTLHDTKWGLVFVPLTVFRSNSKFDQNLKCSGLTCTTPITTKYCTCHYSVTVVTCAKCRFHRLNILFKLEHSKFWSNFEFDRNVVSGTGAWFRFPFITEQALRLWQKTLDM